MVRPRGVSTWRWRRPTCSSRRPEQVGGHTAVAGGSRLGPPRRDARAAASLRRSSAQAPASTPASMPASSRRVTTSTTRGMPSLRWMARTTRVVSSSTSSTTTMATGGEIDVVVDDLDLRAGSATGWPDPPVRSGRGRRRTPRSVCSHACSCFRSKGAACRQAPAEVDHVTDGPHRALHDDSTGRSGCPIGRGFVPPRRGRRAQRTRQPTKGRQG